MERWEPKTAGERLAYEQGVRDQREGVTQGMSRVAGQPESDIAEPQLRQAVALERIATALEGAGPFMEELARAAVAHENIAAALDRFETLTKATLTAVLASADDTDIPPPVRAALASYLTGFPNNPS